MVDVGPRGPCHPCCRAWPGHRQSCTSDAARTRRAETDPIEALTEPDVEWLTEHGWEDPRTAEMPTGDAFIERYYTPGLISRD